MIKKTETIAHHYFDNNDNLRTMNVKYSLWFRNNQLVDIRNQLTEIGFSVERGSDVYEYFMNKYPN